MRSTREEESRLTVRTLVIASAAALAAALLTSRFWTAGTPIAAALTPVIVAIVSELLHRPTEAIAKRVTTERTAPLPRDLEGEPTQVRVYRSEPRRGWGRIHPKIVVVTGLLAFAIAAAAFTLPELIAGQSLGKNDRKTTFFGGRDRSDESAEPQTTQQTVPEEPQPEETAPQEEQPTTTEEQPTTTTEEPTLTVPTVPSETPAQP